MNQVSAYPVHGSGFRHGEFVNVIQNNQIYRSNAETAARTSKRML